MLIGIGDKDAVMRKIAHSGKIGLEQWISYVNKRKVKSKKKRKKLKRRKLKN